MNPAIITALVNAALDAAISIIKGLNSTATVDDAIAALEVAKSKTAQDYLDEDKAKNQ